MVCKGAASCFQNRRVVSRSWRRVFFGLQVGYLWHFLPCLKIQDFQIKVEMKRKKSPRQKRRQWGAGNYANITRNGGNTKENLQGENAPE